MLRSIGTTDEVRESGCVEKGCQVVALLARSDRGPVELVLDDSRSVFDKRRGQRVARCRIDDSMRSDRKLSAHCFM